MKPKSNKDIQLSIPFDIASDEGSIIKSKNNNPTNFLVNLELSKFPFFFLSKTDKVKKSRIGLKKYLEYKKLLSNNNTDYKTIVEKTSFVTSPAMLIHTEEFTLGNSNEVWRIESHQNYGLPDEFDNYIWEYILYILSHKYYSFKKIYPFLSFNKVDVFNYLSSNYGYKKSGKLYNNIDLSLERLLYTKYFHSKGFYLKSNNVYTQEDYSFSLIKNIYRKNQRIKNEEYVNTDYLIQIDPIIYYNFLSSYFLISPNSLRLKLKHLISKIIYDKLNFMLFHFLTNNTDDYIVSLKYNYPTYLYMNVSNLFYFLSLTYPSNRNNKKSYILNRLNPFLNELISAGFLNSFFLDKKNSNSFNIFFIIDDNYISDFIDNINKDFKIKLDTRKKNIDFNSSKKYFSKLKATIQEEENLSHFSNLH